MFGAYIIWCCLLLYVLGTTADQYFAPALIQLSDWLGLRPRVAGVTLLALGNGAPDVFSVIAAYRAGQVKAPR
jgi:sodium/potassium/calcium exchanger 6